MSVTFAWSLYEIELALKALHELAFRIMLRVSRMLFAMVRPWRTMSPGMYVSMAQRLGLLTHHSFQQDHPMPQHRFMYLQVFGG